MTEITVRKTCAEDLPLLIALQKQIYPDIPPWSEGKLSEQLEAFPRGQLVADSPDGLLGCASSIIVAWDDWAEPHSWKEITTSGTFENHNPLGRTLYGVEVFVDPECQGQGVGHLLYEARRSLCREMNLKRIICCGRLPGYHKPQFVLLPEIFTTQLLSFMDTNDVHKSVRNMNDYTRRYKDLMLELAAQWNIHLIGGSHPTLHEDGRLLNTAYYFTPSGRIFQQDKIHRTRWEREKWNTDAGDKLHLFDTPFGKIAILICYDIEFPELARMVCEAGADILMVPSCTDDRQGFLRVRYCCHARAIENQVFVVMTSTVGNLPVEGLGMHYGQAAIITPSDFSFARDGIAAEGTPNIEQIIVADVDLQDLVTNRLSGTTIPLYDKRKDIYENAVEVIAIS